ncbi:phosphoglycerate kinase [Candidatus Saccharibacteria bacterium]|nr:phosphoglycerate kinase [Candidatus Saccharibacteria bacterium]
MGFDRKTLIDIDLKGKTVLVRVDYNVPIQDGKITDDYRIRQSLPTIEYLRSQKCRIVLCSHLGRPDGKPVMKYSLKPCAQRLSKLLDDPVAFSPECVGSEAQAHVQALKPGQVLLLENLRFHSEEEANDKAFAAQLAELAQVFVQDGFGVVHRSHASTDAITKLLPSVAGKLLEREVDTITNVMQNPERPLLAIIGGSKISDKIEILNKFMDIADFVAVGGAMANTFLLAEGIRVGKSLVERDEIELAKTIIEKARRKAKEQQFVFYIPQDGVVATIIDKRAHTRIVDWDAHVIASIESYPSRPKRESGTVAADELILDIGPFSGAFIAGGIQLAQTVVWNGTMGVTEVDGLQGPIGPFAHGTDVVVDAVLGEFGHKPYSLVGGGDTVGYLRERKLTDLFDHVSTGGGASMELMSGKKLPGVAALLPKKAKR